MAVYKGIGIVAIRRLVQERGGTTEAQLLQQLEPEEAALYKYVTSTALIPIEIANRLLLKAGPLLFPDDPEPLVALGEAIAKDNLRGPYRHLVRPATIPVLIRQASKIWRLYHARGHAWAEAGPAPGSAIFVVRDYPELPDSFQEMLAGFIRALVGITRKKNIRVIRDSSDCQAWKWMVYWDGA